jgi:cell division protein FtsQ
MSRRIVGNFKNEKTRGASALTPRRDRQHLFAAVGRVMLAILGLGLVAVMGIGVKEAFVQVNSQKIGTVQIEGSLTFLSKSDLEDAVNQFVETSMVALELDHLKMELESKPWVNSAEVRRVWPDRLIIKVEEEVAIARWGNNQLLNQQGRIFEPDSINEHMQLPQLAGPAGTESKVMRQYLQFNQLMYPLGARIRELELNGRGAWSLSFSGINQANAQINVKVRVGKSQVLERLKRLVTFLAVQGPETLLLVESIDLRYANGLAVAWRDPDAHKTTMNRGKGQDQNHG